MGKIFYLPQPTYDGRILGCSYDRDLPIDTSTMNPDFLELEFSEAEGSPFDLYHDMIETLHQIDAVGEYKYIIIDDAGTLKIDEEIDWKPFDPLGAKK